MVVSLKLNHTVPSECSCSTPSPELSRVDPIDRICSLNYLLSSSQGGSPEEPPRIMTLFDVIRTIKFIEGDDRIVSFYRSPRALSFVTLL